MEVINQVVDAFKNASEVLFGWTQFIPSYFLVVFGLVIGFVIFNAIVHIIT